MSSARDGRSTRDRHWPRLVVADGGPAPLQWLTWTNAALARVAAYMLGILLVGMTAVIGAAVYFRYVANSSLTWGEEAARYLAIWLVFLGIGVAHRWSQHVRIGFIPARFAGRPRFMIDLVVELIVLVLFALIAWFGWEIAMSNFGRGQVSPALGIPIAWIYLALPVGFGLGALQSLERALCLAYALITRKEIEIPFGQMPDDDVMPAEGYAG